MNPGLPRSGKRERLHKKSTGLSGREAVEKEVGDSRKARKPEDLPAPGNGETTEAGSTWSLEGGP